VEPQAGIPVLLQPLRGKSHEGKAFGQVRRDHLAPLPPTAPPTYRVAARALSSAEPLHTRADTSLQWSPRLPATWHEAQAGLAQAAPQTMAPRTAG
jgi:hypothetical protein